MLRQVETVGLVPRPGRRKNAVWKWVATHRNVVSVAVSAMVTALLLATASIPPLLAPFVFGPLAAVVVTALIAPRDTAGPAARAQRVQRRRHV